MNTIKMFIVRIGYQDYAVAPSDIATLCEIAQSSPPVDQDSYAGLWHAGAETRNFLTDCHLGDFVIQDDSDPGAAHEPELPSAESPASPDSPAIPF